MTDEIEAPFAPDEVQRRADAYPRLVQALKNVQICAERQLEGHGKGIPPSINLQAAFDATDALLRELGEA